MWELILCHPFATFMYGLIAGQFIKYFSSKKLEKWKIKRSKDEEAKTWKKKYLRYKNDNGPSIESLRECKKNSNGVLPREICDAMGNSHNFPMLIRYGFAVDNGHGVSLEDIFMDLFEDDLGGVDRY